MLLYLFALFMLFSNSLYLGVSIGVGDTFHIVFSCVLVVITFACSVIIYVSQVEE